MCDGTAYPALDQILVRGTNESYCFTFDKPSMCVHTYIYVFVDSGLYRLMVALEFQADSRVLSFSVQ